MPVVFENHRMTTPDWASAACRRAARGPLRRFHGASGGSRSRGWASLELGRDAGDCGAELDQGIVSVFLKLNIGLLAALTAPCMVCLHMGLIHDIATQSYPRVGQKLQLPYTSNLELI